MKKEISSSDKISEPTLHEILLDIKYRLDHLEDIEADNRTLIVKLIKQSNSIVKFLAQIDFEAEEHIAIEDMELPPLREETSINPKRIKHIKELIDEYMDKHTGLKELEKELKKNKVMLTPGQVGEA